MSYNKQGFVSSLFTTDDMTVQAIMMEKGSECGAGRIRIKK